MFEAQKSSGHDLTGSYGPEIALDILQVPLSQVFTCYQPSTFYVMHVYNSFVVH